MQGSGSCLCLFLFGAIMTTYQEQLEHPQWQRKRLEILSSKGFQCECCRDTEKQLHVHHKRYIKGRDVWDYDNENFLCLCRECHKERHDIEKKIADIAANLSYGWLLRLVGYADALSGSKPFASRDGRVSGVYKWGVIDKSSEPPDGSGLKMVQV